MDAGQWQAAWTETLAEIQAVRRDHDVVIAEMNKYVAGFTDPPPDLLDQARAINSRLRAIQDRQDDLLRRWPTAGGG